MKKEKKIMKKTMKRMKKMRIYSDLFDYFFDLIIF